MVEATIFKNDKNEIIEYKIKGHANFDDYGQDIVCAAVSVLSQNTLISLFEVVGLDKKSVEYRIDDNTGFIYVKLLKDIEPSLYRETQLLLKSLEVGIKSVAESYPKHVTLNYEGV